MGDDRGGVVQMMLIPVNISPRRRIWVDVSFRYEKQICVNSPEALYRYILKYGHVDGVYDDEQIAYDVRRTITSRLQDDVSRRQVVWEVSDIYGIPVECVGGIMDEVMPEIRSSPPPSVRGQFS